MTDLSPIQMRAQSAGSLDECCQIAGEIPKEGDIFGNEAFVIGSAMRFIDNPENLIELQKNLKSWKGLHLLVKTYVEQKGIQSRPEFLALIRRLDPRHEGGQEARIALYQASEHLRIVENDTSLNELCEIAAMVQDMPNDGTGSVEEEQRIIEVALPQLTTASLAVKLAKSFQIKTGTHRTLIAYVGTCGVHSQSDYLDLMNTVKDPNYLGLEAEVAIFRAGEHLIQFSESSSLRDLGRAAKMVCDVEGDGSGSREKEDEIIALVLPMIKNTKKLLKFVSNSFNTTTGQFRLIIAYVDERGVGSKRDVRFLLEFIVPVLEQDVNYCAREALATVLRAGKEAGVDIQDSLPDGRCQCMMCQLILTSLEVPDIKSLWQDCRSFRALFEKQDKAVFELEEMEEFFREAKVSETFAGIVRKDFLSTQKEAKKAKPKPKSLALGEPFITMN